MPQPASQLVTSPLLPSTSSQDWPTMISGMTMVRMGSTATRFLNGNS